MVAKVITGKTMRGVLSYNENKVKDGSAICLAAHGYYVEVNRLTFGQKFELLNGLQERNLRSKTKTVHISLNFDKSDRLGADKLKQIALSYVQKIGFEKQPFLLYQHFDAAHPHVHIVTTSIRRDGSRISLNNIGRNESEQARKEIEIEYNLVKAQGRKSSDQMLKPADLTRAVYGKSETKRAISNIVNTVTRSYKFTSIHELNAVLKQYNVMADRGKEGTLINSKNGLRYFLLDTVGNPVGIPIKASSIYGKPTLATLSNQFEVNNLLRGPHKQRLKEVIDSFAFGKKNGLDDFVKYMVANKVYPVIRQNEEGRVYGITFIDNTTKCVFNGSALGKEYSAKGIMDRLVPNRKTNPGTIPVLPTKDDTETSCATDIEPAISQSGVLQDLMDANPDHSNTPYELRKKRKRRGRSI